MDTQAKQDRSARPKKLVNIEACVPWIAWVDGLADREGLSRGALIDQALRRYAKTVGYDDKPPRR